MSRRGEVHAFALDEDDPVDERWAGWSEDVDAVEGAGGAPGASGEAAEPGEATAHHAGADLDLDGFGPVGHSPLLGGTAPRGRRVLGALLAAAAGALVGTMIAAGVRAVSNSGSPPGSAGAPTAGVIAPAHRPSNGRPRRHERFSDAARPAQARPHASRPAGGASGGALTASRGRVTGGGDQPATGAATPGYEAPRAAGGAAPAEEAEAEFGFER